MLFPVFVLDPLKTQLTTATEQLLHIIKFLKPLPLNVYHVFFQERIIIHSTTNTFVIWNISNSYHPELKY